MGLGAALFEEVRYEEGQLLERRSLPVPPAAAGGHSRKTSRRSSWSTRRPRPLRRQGHRPDLHSAASPRRRNAIFDAIGIRLTTLPFTPEKVLRALGELAVPGELAG